MAGANTYDFLNEGTYSTPAGYAPTKPLDPNDVPNPANPGGMSNNDLWNNADHQTRIGNATANSNSGVPGGLGTDPSIAPGQGPILTTGAVQQFTDSRGRPITVNRQTPQQMRDYNMNLIHVDDLGTVAPNLANTGKNAAAGALTGAAVGGAPGALIGAGVGAFSALPGPQVHQLGSTALTDAELAANGITNPADIAAYRQTHGYPGSTGTAAAPVRGGNPGGTVYPAPGVGVGGAAGAPSQAATTAFSLGNTFMDRSQGVGAAGAAPRTDAASQDVATFLNEERARKGPSEAEALLNKSADRIQAQALGLAASARGGAGARERATQQAISGNAYVGSNATADVAALRAREEAQRRDRLLAIMNLASANAGRGDVLAGQYASTGADLYGRGVTAEQGTENNASNERVAAANQTGATTRQSAQQAFDSRNDPSFIEGLATNPYTINAFKKLFD